MFELYASSFRAGIAGDRLLIPYFLPTRLTWAVYNDFLRNVLLELLEDVELQTGIHLWFVHGGARLHFLLTVQELLKNVFPEQ